MQYALAIYAPPGATANTAQRFAASLLEKGHSIQRLFFFSDGVLNCTLDNRANESWRELIRNHQIDAVACVASAHKRGVYDEATARQRQLAAPTLAPEFEISGLGQLIDAGIAADRFLTFA